VLGKHVQQKGSLVQADKLRFDFSHDSAISADEMEQIESLVNEQIRMNNPVETNLMNIEQAMASGAMALFGEKYGDEVRVLRMGEFSCELCGGTHVSRTGDIGILKVTSEGGVAAGVRRVEAVVGPLAEDWIRSNEQRIAHIASLLKTGRDQVDEKVTQLVDKVRGLEKELDKMKAKMASSMGSDLTANAIEIAGVKVLAAEMPGADAKTLRDTVDQLKNKLGSAAILLASVEDGKVRLAAGVSKDATARIKAGDLVNHVATQVGGRGGGRPDMAQAGGTEPDKLPAALASVEDWARGQLS
ncbi:MAG: DHHA1 domain-containing protein, partial [Gammaproteobacteria bacterium]|nr:DHHA1 domain-containing protein [Gammaproteobacteria bacterium]